MMTNGVINLSSTHQKKMTENIIDRDELQNDYIERIIDGMDHKTMYQYIYDMLEQNFEKYTVDELIGEVEEYYPDLLDS